MDESEVMREMRALEDARKLLQTVRLSLAGVNEFAYRKLYNSDAYLSTEQAKLGRQMFSESEVEQAAAEYSAEWRAHAEA